MAERRLFIGRSEELGKILSLARQKHSTNVLFVEGRGGIGKTALLNEAQILCRSEIGSDELLVTDIIDFDDRANLIPENVRKKITEMLGADHFSRYITAVKQLRTMEKEGLSGDRLREKKKEVRTIFADDFNAVSRRKRIVLFFDTMDLLPATTVWDRLSRFILDAQNVLFILAGRLSIKLVESITPKLDNKVEVMTLRRMSEKDSQKYLVMKKKRMRLNIPESFERKLLYISRGRPILIDLAVEWLARSFNMEWLENVDPDDRQEIDEERDKKQILDWEKHLVSHIHELQYPIDKLSLILSRIYPLTETGAQHFFDRQDIDISALFKYAQEFVFVKVLPGEPLSISLHDEMRRMVNEYVWPVIDPDGDQRRWESRVALEYIQSHINQVETDIEAIKSGKKNVPHTELALHGLESHLEILQKQRKEHHVFINLFENFEIYKGASEQASRAYDDIFAKRLQDAVKSLYNLFTEDQKFNFDLIKGKLLYRLHENDKAQHLFNELLEKNLKRNNEPRLAEIYNGLGVSEMYLGNLQAALEYQKKSLALFKKLKDDNNIPKVANQIGLIYSKLEKWEEAIATFKEALEITEKLPPEDDTFDVMAGILNYWGYVYGMVGRFVEAVAYCQGAIKIWTNLGLERKTARGFALLGAVYRIMEKYDLAEKYLEKAINGIEFPNDSERLIKAYSELGFTYHIMGPNQEQIIKAQSYLENGVEYAEMHGERLELPLLLSRLARLYWLFFQHTPENYSEEQIAEYKLKARETNEKAYQKGKEINHTYTVAKCILGRAEFDIEDPEVSNERIPEYAEALEKLLEGAQKKYPLFSGRMDRIRAEIAIEAQDYEQALIYYGSGLSKINQHGGYGVYSIEEELSKMTQKLIMDAHPDKAIAHIKWLKNYWSDAKNGGETQNRRLISWCRQQSIDIKLGAKG